MATQPFNYGNTLAQAENIRGGRITNALNQQKLSQNAMNPQGNPEYGKQVQYALDANKNLRGFAVGDDGTVKELNLPEGMTWADTYTAKDIGGLMQMFGRRTGAQGGQPPVNGQPPVAGQPPITQSDPYAPVKKTLAPEKEIDYIGKAATAKEQSVKDVQLEMNPQIKSGEAKQTVIGKQAGNLEIQKPKRIVSAAAERDKTTRLKSLITKAKTQATGWTTGFLGSKSKGIAGTPAYDLSQTLSTLQANAGFDRLQEMRNASITGGALGQVSERELALLVDSYSAIGQAQSKQQFIQNLDAFEKQLDQSWSRVNMAYELDYGEKYTGQELQPQEQQGPQTITTQEEFNALPSGATFIEDGMEYTKP